MGLPVVLMPGPMHPAVAQGLEGHCELIRLWEESDPDAVLAARRDEIVAVATGGGRIDGPFLDRLPAVRIVASFGVGYDRIDANAAAERGVVVTNTPGVLDDEVADTALGLLLMAVRELPQAERYLRAGKWQDGPYPLTRATMHGRRMGILGGDSTRHLVDAEVLQALGPDGILINVSRGSVVDEQALVDALRTNTILSAGLDVFEHEPKVHPDLLTLPNAVLLPHVGSATMPTRTAMGNLVVDNLRNWLAHGTPLTPVPESAELVRRLSGSE